MITPYVHRVYTDAEVRAKFAAERARINPGEEWRLFYIDMAERGYENNGYAVMHEEREYDHGMENVTYYHSDGTIHKAQYSCD